MHGDERTVQDRTVNQMNDLIFRIHREPCVPNPCYRDAKAAKEKISSLGGRFYRFSINGCASTAKLERYLVEQYGLSESAVGDILETMAETIIPELGAKLREVWGVVECTDCLESTYFTGFAFTEKELENKTRLFIAGVAKVKEHLESLLNTVADNFPARVTWDV